MGDLFGGGKSPEVQTSAVQDIEEEQKKAKKGRSALFATEGGILGQEVQAGQITKRDTIFGN